MSKEEKDKEQNKEVRKYYDFSHLLRFYKIPPIKRETIVNHMFNINGGSTLNELNFFKSITKNALVNTFIIETDIQYMRDRNIGYNVATESKIDQMNKDVDTIDTMRKLCELVEININSSKSLMRTYQKLFDFELTMHAKRHNIDC